MKLESIENERVKYFKKTRDIKYIKKYHEFIVEGEHLVQEAIACGFAKELIVLLGRTYDSALPVTYVSNKVLNHISLLETPQYVMALCKTNEVDTLIGKRILILDNVNDPGNLGTIIRTSVAFGVDTVVLSENSANMYNDKVLRASQGMAFKINIIERDITSLIEILKKDKIKIFGTSLKGKEFEDIKKPDSFALILGNEGCGVRREILSLCDEEILLQMDRECESLNVAVSAGIILYNWREK